MHMIDKRLLRKRFLLALAMACTVTACAECTDGDASCAEGVEQGTVFPIEQIGDIICAECGPVEDDGTRTAVPIEEIHGLQAEIDSKIVNIAESQMQIQTNPTGGIISGSAIDENGKVTTFTFTVVTLGQNLPYDYTLTVDEVANTEKAFLAYSEVVSGEAELPVAAQSISNGILHLDEFSETAVVGTFSMDLVLVNSETRSVRDGVIRINSQE